MVVDFGCDPRCIYNIHHYRAAICTINHDIFFLSCPPGLMGDLAHRADSIPGPVTGNAVGKSRLAGIGWAVNTNTGPFLFYKPVEEVGKFLLYPAISLIKYSHGKPPSQRIVQRYKIFTI